MRIIRLLFIHCSCHVQLLDKIICFTTIVVYFIAQIDIDYSTFITYHHIREERDMSNNNKMLTTADDVKPNQRTPKIIGNQTVF